MFQAHRLCASLNSRLESNQEEERKKGWRYMDREKSMERENSWFSLRSRVLLPHRVFFSITLKPRVE